ncbi:hypothetical protein CYMTET_43625 [Cymbomonas tetramitiformis]|uniref:Ion transport domain-containing protein n=1 Tax=Cymbomonas tetramitiformis TaxID=36881 RepID=A0AAE0C1T8_9CHLO|nr:hypothetical protein CYMTET_43625 [Cymbomonas tetramitiformis]
MLGASSQANAHEIVAHDDVYQPRSSSNGRATLGSFPSKNPVTFSSGSQTFTSTVAVGFQTENVSTSLYFLSPDNRFRVFCTKLVEDPLFDKFLLTAIIFTTIALVAESSGVSGAFWSNLEIACLLVYAFDLTLKFIAYGFFAYLSTPLNFLDFICTLSNLMLLFPAVSSISGLGALKVVRCIRILEPLRSLRRYPRLQILSETLYQGFPEMAKLITVVGFIVIVFGIVGLQLFRGLLHHRCHAVDGNGEMTGVVTRTCMLDRMQAVTKGFYCEANEVCAFYQSNPNGGTTGFDNILEAMYTVFQSITLEGWTDTMYKLTDAAGQLSVIYSLAIVVTGAFVVMNLALAVIFDSYLSCKEQVRAERRSPGA